jgi:hypothetical protein
MNGTRRRRRGGHTEDFLSLNSTATKEERRDEDLEERFGVKEHDVGML